MSDYQPAPDQESALLDNPHRSDEVEANHANVGNNAPQEPIVFAQPIQPIDYNYHQAWLPPYPTYNTVGEYFSALTGFNKVWIIMNVLILFIVLIVNWRAFLFMPLFYLPLYYVHKVYKRHATEIAVDELAHQYVIPNSVGCCAVLCAQLILTIIFALIFLGKFLQDYLKIMQKAQETQSRVDEDQKELFDSLKYNPGLYVFLFVMGFVIAGLVEESLKYRMINSVRYRRPNYRVVEGYKLYAIVAALGFSVLENIGYQISFSQSTDNLGEILLNAVERLLISTPIHVACGYMIGLRVIRRDVYGQQLHLFHVMKWSVFFHGNFDFWLFIIAVTASGATASFLLELLVVAFTVAAFAYVLKKENKYVDSLRYAGVNHEINNDINNEGGSGHDIQMESLQQV
jgi:RsiW-degrading membrane proteinase PrsW (M82 family)